MWEIFLQGHILSTAGDALTSYAAELCSNKLQTVNILAFFVLEKFRQKMKLKFWNEVILQVFNAKKWGEDIIVITKNYIWFWYRSFVRSSTV